MDAWDSVLIRGKNFYLTIMSTPALKAPLVSYLVGTRKPQILAVKWQEHEADHTNLFGMCGAIPSFLNTS
jgi:hypothetical protein